MLSIQIKTIYGKMTVQGKKPEKLLTMLNKLVEGNYLTLKQKDEVKKKIIKIKEVEEFLQPIPDEEETSTVRTWSLDEIVNSGCQKEDPVEEETYPELEENIDSKSKESELSSEEHIQYVPQVMQSYTTHPLGVELMDRLLTEEEIRILISRCSLGPSLPYELVEIFLNSVINNTLTNGMLSVSKLTNQAVRANSDWRDVRGKLHFLISSGIIIKRDMNLIGIPKRLITSKKKLFTDLNDLLEFLNKYQSPYHGEHLLSDVVKFIARHPKGVLCRDIHNLHSDVNVAHKTSLSNITTKAIYALGALGCIYKSPPKMTNVCIDDHLLPGVGSSEKSEDIKITPTTSTGVKMSIDFPECVPIHNREIFSVLLNTVATMNRYPITRSEVSAEVRTRLTFKPSSGYMTMLQAYLKGMCVSGLLKTDVEGNIFGVSERYVNLKDRPFTSISDYLEFLSISRKWVSDLPSVPTFQDIKEVLRICETEALGGSDISKRLVKPSGSSDTHYLVHTLAILGVVHRAYKKGSSFYWASCFGQKETQLKLPDLTPIKDLLKKEEPKRDLSFDQKREHLFKIFEKDPTTLKAFNGDGKCVLSDTMEFILKASPAPTSIYSVNSLVLANTTTERRLGNSKIDTNEHLVLLRSAINFLERYRILKKTKISNSKDVTITPNPKLAEILEKIIDPANITYETIDDLVTTIFNMSQLDRTVAGVIITDIKSHGTIYFQKLLDGIFNMIRKTPKKDGTYITLNSMKDNLLVSYIANIINTLHLFNIIDVYKPNSGSNPSLKAVVRLTCDIS